LDCQALQSLYIYLRQYKLSSLTNDNTGNEFIKTKESVELSSEQLERILSTLRSDGACSASKEKRHGPRVGLRCAVTVIEPGTGAECSRATSLIRNVSREGIGLQHSHAMKAGQRFLVQFPYENGEYESFLCTVRRCQAAGPDAFHVGASFIRVCDVSPKNDGTNVNVTVPEVPETHAETEADASARIRRAILA
jgi:hypothetical protein